MKFKSFLDELKYMEEISDKSEMTEDLKIVKKNWSFDIPGYTVDINDKVQHSLLQRAQLRTRTPLNKIHKAMQHGLEYIVKKINSGKISNRVMISLTFTKSEFKLLVLVNPDEKYLRVSTIMNPDMETKRDIKWNLNEFQEIFWKLNIENNETFGFDCDLDICPGTTFLAEPALFENTHEIFQQENIEDFKFSI